MNDWHSDFYAAIKQLFKDEDLKIIQEEYLSKEPLRIDVIIIKNLDSHQIKKQIGKIFKKYNIIEYKSPTDYISIDDYFKGLSYTYLDKSTMNADGKDKKETNDIEAAFRKNIKKAVEVYKMYEDMINEEVQEYVIKTLKQTRLKIYAEQKLK